MTLENRLENQGRSLQLSLPADLTPVRISEFAASLPATTDQLRIAAVEMSAGKSAQSISEHLLRISKSLIRLRQNPTPFLETALNLIPNFDLGLDPVDSENMLEVQCSTALDIADTQLAAAFDTRHALNSADNYLEEIKKRSLTNQRFIGLVSRKARIERGNINPDVLRQKELLQSPDQEDSQKDPTNNFTTDEQIIASMLRDSFRDIKIFSLDPNNLSNYNIRDLMLKLNSGVRDGDGDTSTTQRDIVTKLEKIKEGKPVGKDQNESSRFRDVFFKVLSFMEIAKMLFAYQMDPEIVFRYTEEEISASKRQLNAFRKKHKLNKDIDPRQAYMGNPADIAKSAQKSLDMSYGEMAVVSVLLGQKERANGYLSQLYSGDRRTRVCRTMIAYYHHNGQIDDILDILDMTQDQETNALGIRALGLVFIQKGDPLGEYFLNMPVNYDKYHTGEPMSLDVLLKFAVDKAIKGEDTQPYLTRLLDLMDKWFKRSGNLFGSIIAEEYEKMVGAIAEAGIDPDIFLRPFGEKLASLKKIERDKFWNKGMRGRDISSFETSLVRSQVVAGKLAEAISTLEDIGESQVRNEAAVEALTILIENDRANQIGPFLARIRGGEGKFAALATALEALESKVARANPSLLR